MDLNKYAKNNALGWAVWLLLAIFVIINRSLSPVDHADVFVIYRDVALKWIQGEGLYDGSGTGFIYFPQAAVLFTPLSQLPVRLDSILWRLLNIGIFAVGVFGYCRLASFRFRTELFLPVTLVSVLMCTSAAKLGQVTLIMAGLMLLAVVDVTQKHWWRAACWLILAFALKPLALVLILLVGALYPRTILPLLTGFLILLLAPFATQSPEYVWGQYQAGVITMGQVADVGEVKPFAQLFWVLRRIGIDTSEQIQWLVRVALGLATLGYCWWLQRRLTPGSFAVYLYAIVACYILLLNPRTENNTYAMLGPALGVFTVWSCHAMRRLWCFSHLAIVLFYLLSNRIGKLLIGAPTIWIKPILCLVFLVLVMASAGKHRESE